MSNKIKTVWPMDKTEISKSVSYWNLTIVDKINLKNHDSTWTTNSTTTGNLKNLNGKGKCESIQFHSDLNDTVRSCWATTSFLTQFLNYESNDDSMINRRYLGANCTRLHLLVLENCIRKSYNTIQSSEFRDNED